MLVDISFATELKIQDITILLFLIQEFINSEFSHFGFLTDPSMNPTLIFTDNEIIIAWLQEA